MDGDDDAPPAGSHPDSDDLTVPTSPWTAPPPEQWKVGADGSLDLTPSPWQHAMPYVFAVAPLVTALWNVGPTWNSAWIWVGAASVFLFFFMISVGCTVHVIADDLGLEIRVPPLTRKRLAWDEIDKVEIDLTRLSHTKMWVRIFVKGSQRWPRTRTVNLGYRQAKQAAELLAGAATRHGVTMKITDVNPPKASR